ncbi:MULTISPECIES: hypothetical protein [Pontibacter]|uniref:Outer membrane protein beta-barrel domain-containing protein n=1 Tax=Pontibacter lucknowensis TaxID=1077936 RepID=A0A1N6YFS3_9BACT|nr:MULTISPECIES: hypothetical protein [Pontibacter]EJF10262.1 hypothetical protein O71_10204 [Pontibacter sp. BAB1700]SIR13475.1 hypothetical protein SAMN05421545_2471 [Pontibacter lucknowensis]
MSTNNMSDEELDNLFRKSAERYDPPFDEEAWKAMDRKLDHAQGGLAGLYRLWPLVLLVLLVTVGTVWKLMERDAPLQESTSVAVKQEPGLGSEIAAIPDHAKGVEHATVPAPESPAALYPAVQPGAGTVAQSEQKPVQRSSGRALSESQAIPVSRGAIMEEPLPTATSRMQLARVDMPQLATGIAPQKVALPIPAEDSIPADSSQSDNRGERVFLRSVRVMLVAAPDMTTVRFKDPDAVSANAGMLFSVPITRRLSLVSGAVWANKRYNATPADYAPSPDYWDGKRLPDLIAAQCRVLDIPINLQYQLLGWGKNVLTVQAGLSSYLMLHESYTYTYHYNGREPYSKTREFSNENRHWFGVQNLSVGYTRQLSPAFSIGAEPFVKIPLASIGEGRVKLTSAGVFFTAGFTFR